MEIKNMSLEDSKIKDLENKKKSVSQKKSKKELFIKAAKKELNNESLNISALMKERLKSATKEESQDIEDHTITNTEQAIIKNKISQLLNSFKNWKNKKIILKKITQNQPIPNENNKETKIKFILITLAILALIGLASFIFSTDKPTLFLKTTPIDITPQSTDIQNNFKIGNRIYLLYQHNKKFSGEPLTIKVYQGKIIKKEILSLSVQLPENKKSFATHFQKDFFTKEGNYLIEILSKENKLLTSQVFSLE